MNSLGTLNGRGVIQVHDEELGHISYDISVWQDPSGMKTASGTLQGDYNILYKAFNVSEHALLFLEEGGNLKFIITNLDTSGLCEITVSGPIPGF